MDLGYISQLTWSVVHYRSNGDEGGTGRRGRVNPRRPVLPSLKDPLPSGSRRQPPPGLADAARPFVALGGRCRRGSLLDVVRIPGSQIDIAKCCAPKKFPPTVEFGSFPFRYITRGNGMPGGNNSGASDVPLGSRVRLPNSAGRHLAGNVPGEAGRGNQRISRAERESPGAEALTAVWISHRVSAGGLTARSPIKVTPQVYSGKDLLLGGIHHRQARLWRGRWTRFVLWDWACRRRTCRGSNHDRVGPRRPVRKRWQLEDQHR